MTTSKLEAELLGLGDAAQVVARETLGLPAGEDIMSMGPLCGRRAVILGEPREGGAEVMVAVSRENTGTDDPPAFRVSLAFSADCVEGVGLALAMLVASGLGYPPRVTSAHVGLATRPAGEA